MLPQSASANIISTAAWRVLAAIFLVGTINFMDRSLLSIAMPSIRAEFNWSPTLAGVALSSFLWTYAVGNAVTAPFVDRYGPRRSQALGMLFWTVSLVWTAVTQSFYSLLGSRALLGIAEAPNQAIAIRSIRSFFPEQHTGFACSVGVALVVRVGPICGFVLGGFLIGEFGWRAAFLMLAALSLLAIPLWFTMFPKSGSLPSSVQAKSVGTATGDVMQFFRYPRFWAVMIGMSANSYIQYLFFSWTPGYLSTLFKTNIMNIGFMSAAIFGFGVLGNLVSGYGGDVLLRRGYSRLAVRKRIILLGICLCLPIVIVPQFTSLWGVIFILSLADFGINVAVPQFWATMSETAPPHLTASFTGLVNGVANGVGLFAPIVTGAIVDATGSFQLAFLVAGGMLSVIGVCYGLCLRRIEPLFVRA